MRIKVFKAADLKEAMAMVKDELGRDAGLVFIGGSTSKGFVTRELNLSGSRTEIRRQAVYEALKLLYKLAKTI